MDQSVAELEAKKVYQKSMKMLERAKQAASRLPAEIKADHQKIDRIISDVIDLFQKSEGTKSPESSFPAVVKDALERIRVVAELIADEDTESESVKILAKTIAGSMALMYPISRLDEGPSRIPASPYADSEAASPFEDRRASPRMAIEADIGFQSDTNFFMGFAEDISAGGLFISTFDTREIGDQITVNFTLPNGHLVSAQGVVRWIREYNEMIPDTHPGMGVQFQDLDENDKEIINQFIEKRAPIFYDE